MSREIQEYLRTVPDDYVQYHLKRTLRLMDRPDIDRMQNIIQRFISFIPSDLHQKDKAALLYEVVTRRSHYMEEENESRFVFVAALISGKAVCMGIAELYAILCSRAGISCRIVVGYAWNHTPEDGCLHAWNMVRLPENGTYRWYHCDPTWDLDELRVPDRRFFLKSDEYMRENNHIWLADRYPRCPESAVGKVILNEKGVGLTCRILEEVIASALAGRG